MYVVTTLYQCFCVNTSNNQMSSDYGSCDEMPLALGRSDSLGVVDNEGRPDQVERDGAVRASPDSC